MHTIVRTVGDLSATDRSAIERVVGQPLQEREQLIIQIVPPASKLPDWCNVFAGLSPAEIDAIDQAIVRTHSTRDVE